MKKEYDFKRGKRGAVLKAPPGKIRITIRIDEDILQAFRAQVHAAGGGSYQTLINRALREHVESSHESLKKLLRSVVREELAEYSKNEGTSQTKRSSAPEKARAAERSP